MSRNCFLIRVSERKDTLLSEQGQIDKILSGKPEERRELFDEAAGIVKFKKRKQAAQKNLEAEKQNLYRVNDILSELEKQVGPLKRQADTARTYLKMRII